MLAADVQVPEHLTSSEWIAYKVTYYNPAPSISVLKESIEKTCKILDKIEKEYEEYLLLRQLIAEVEERINLATLVQQDIKKPVRGGKYGLLLPEQINACLLEKTVVQYL
ncbi:unnamed protein product [Rhizopus microsporus]